MTASSAGGTSGWVAQPGQGPLAICGRAEQRADNRASLTRRGKGALAGDCFVKNDPQPVDVGAAVDRLGRSFRQSSQVLGRHVVDRTPQRRRRGGFLTRAGARAQVKVEEHGHAVGGDEHVGRLDVAVKHAAVVGVVERLGETGAPPGDRAGVRPGGKELAAGQASSLGALARVDPIEGFDQGCARERQPAPRGRRARVPA